MQEISDCFAVMSELRPHLSQVESITQVRRQQKQCYYHLVYLQADESIEAVAGFRLLEYLTQHFRIYRYIHIQRRTLTHRKIKPVK
jgi:hypothetical protein